MSFKQKLPKIIGYFDEKLNCLYSAIETQDSTLIKQMVVSKDPEFTKQKMVRVEMSFTGYALEPVTVTDTHYSGYTKIRSLGNVRSKDYHGKAHWALGWFKADYTRWLTLSHHDKKETKRILGERPASIPSDKMYNRPTTGFIAAITLSELLAAHVCYAHCADCDGEDDNVLTLGELLDLYIKEFNLKERHSNNLRSITAKIISGLNVNGIKLKNKDPNFTIGVDTFIGKTVN